MTVRKRVEKFHGDPVPVGDDPEGTSLNVFHGHAAQGVGQLLLDPGRLGDLLQIIPEHTLPQPQEQLPLQSKVSSAAFAITGLDANTTAPKIGKAPFAARLKNSRRFWSSSFFLFSIVNEI